MIRPRVLVAMLLLGSGCATQHAIRLTSLGGTTYAFASMGDGHPPSRPACAGDAPARFDCFVDAFAPRAEQMGLGASVALVTADDVHTRAIGTLGEHDARAIAETSTFAIGSISKMLLAIAVLSLEGDGRLALDAPISTYVPSLEDRWLGAITLRRLMTHTAGLPLDVACEETLDPAVDALTAQPPWAPPGAVHAYSNAGYTVVADVVEHVTGQRFEDVVRERVLVPLGMRTASYALTDGEHAIGRDAEGHDVGADTRLCRAMQASGGVIATALDLAQLARWLLAHGDALAANGVETGHPFGEHYGLGLERTEIAPGVTLLAHSGRLPHFGAFVGVIPERGTGVVMLVNRSVVPAGPAIGALSTVLELPDAARQPDPRALDASTGCYDDALGRVGRVRITRDGDVLVADMVGEARAALSPIATFFPVSAAPAEWLATPLGIAHRAEDERCLTAE